MKVGLVSAYDYAHPGGVTEHVRHLAAGLRRRGHDVTVFAPCSDKELAERDSDFVRVGRPFPICTSPIESSTTSAMATSMFFITTSR